MTENNAANNNQLRVGYVLKRFPRFSETFILNELLELQRQGLSVEVFSLMHPPQEPRHAMLEQLRVPVTYLPRGSVLGKWKLSSGLTKSADASITETLSADSLPYPQLLPGKDVNTVAHLALQATTLALLAQARGINHFHAHFGSNSTTVALLAGRLARIPFSYTAHARDIYHTYIDANTDDEVRRHKIAEAEFVATVSEYNRRYLNQLAFAGTGEHVRLLYNGIDLSRFAPGKNNQAPNHFVAVGRLVEKKGFPFLIEACRLLRERHHDFHCTLVGDGPDEDSLAGMVSEYQLQEVVKLAGTQPQEQLVQILRSATAVVLPCIISKSGDRDGLPTVLLEAMAMGLATVSTNVAGVPEIIDDGKTGFLVPPEDPLALADVLEQLLTNPQMTIDMGREARIKAEQQFDLHRNVGQLAEWFAESVRRNTSAHYHVE